jgi:hypothetical protein
VSINLNRIFFLVAAFLIHTQAECRVFNFQTERFASYLRAGMGPSTLQKAPFEDSSGTGVTFSDAIEYNYNGEFGFVYTTPSINFVFAFEVLKSQPRTTMTGSDSGGTKLYDFSSDLSGYIPQLGIELNLKTWTTTRFYLAAAAGTADMVLQNNYKLTTDGTAAFAGVSDFREEGKAKANLQKIYIGYESLMSDTTTIALEAGYRTLALPEFSHNLAVTTFNGAVAKGDTMINADGSTRSLNMNGIFGSLVFRFYVN